MALSLVENFTTTREACIRRSGITVSIVAAIVLYVIAVFLQADQNKGPICLQPPPITPKGGFANSLKFASPSYERHSVELLKRAIQIPTVVYANMSSDVLADERFEVFGELSAQLVASFPRAAAHVRKVNHYGLLYTIEGLDRRLDPVLLMAHQDVAPVDISTEGEWMQAPFSGHFDGEYIYGRGSCISKNQLVAVLEAVEDLLAQKWQPQRTVLIALGFDELLDGSRGARALAREIARQHGPHSMGFAVNHGAGIVPIKGGNFAMLAVTERGRADVSVVAETVSQSSNYSFVPPERTSIGIMSEIVTQLEARPFEPHLPVASVISRLFECLAAYAPDLDPKLRRSALRPYKQNEQRRLGKYLRSHADLRPLITSTQTLEYFSGGSKRSPRPEVVELGLSYSIDGGETVQSTIEHVVGVLREVAARHGLELNADGRRVAAGARGSLNVTLVAAVEPAPAASSASAVWEQLCGTTLNVFDDVRVAPSLISGRIATAHYRGVANDIYWFSPVRAVDLHNANGVDEKLRFRSHIASVRWYYEFLINTTV